MISITKPKFKRAERFLDRLDNFDARLILEQFGTIGVYALTAATPVDTGETAGEWSYKVVGNKERYKLIWSNSEMAGRAPLVLLLQYGHATKNGYFLSGRDFINPALRPVYDALNEALIEEALR